jgi:pilus assembly protein CpaC
LVYANSSIEKIDMFVGEIKVLEDLNPDRVAIGNGKLIKAQILPKSQLLLIAENPGSTSLTLWHKDGSTSHFNIRISETDPEARVRLDRMIQMHVKILEFRKSALRNLGIDWSKDIAGPSLAVVGDGLATPLFRGTTDNPIFGNLPNNVDGFQSFFGIATEITSRINYLASTGDAMTLAEPRLSCRNGGTATFLAGGEVPYPVIGADGQTHVEFKDYGIKLYISPVADDSGAIAASILTEVSQIDPAVNVLGAPGFLTRKTETEMNVRAGETIVIAGLLNAESSDDVDKVAGLGDLPVIGSLFRSNRHRNQLTELVVFVTPEIVEPKSPVNKAHIERARERREEHLKAIDEKLDFGLME